MSTLVQVQTLRGTAGMKEAMNTVQTAIAKRNAENPKTEPHVVEEVVALPNNVKGMQWQLALLATLARKHNATMIRLSVHNGHVALCGTAKAVEATRLAMLSSYNQLVTLVANSYSPSSHGNRVGFTNAFLCGGPAGMHDSWNLTAKVEYGIGFLFTFPAPGNGTAYTLGYEAVKALTATAETTTGAARPKRNRPSRSKVTTPEPAEEVEEVA